MLIGGLSGSKRTSAKVSEIAIKVVIDDRVSPVHVVVFLQLPGSGVLAGSAVAKKIGAHVDHWNALLVTGMRNAEIERSNLSSRNLVPPVEATAGVDTADQLAKLWDLKQSGALTEEEFAQEKSRVLTRSDAGSTTSLGKAQASAALEQKQQRHSVKIVDRGARPKEVLSAVRDARPDLQRNQLIRLLTAEPCIVATDLSRAEAEQFKAKLESAGASIALL